MNNDDKNISFGSYTKLHWNFSYSYYYLKSFKTYLFDYVFSLKPY